MALNISFNNFTIGLNDTTRNPYNSEFCPSLLRHVFKTVDSSVPYIVNAALNVTLSITTTFANFLVLLALPHIISIRLPSKLLLYSLLLTDLGAGLTVQPQYAAWLLMKTNQYPRRVMCFLTRSLRFLGWLFGGVSLLTMTAISLDRYIALFYHLRYQQIVTTRRVSTVLIFIWLSPVFVTSTELWAKLGVAKSVTITGLAICFVVISVAYVRIYRRLRGQQGHQVQAVASAQAQRQAGNTFNMARYKKIASTMLWVYVLFVLCYVPLFCIYLSYAAFVDIALADCIWEFCGTVVQLNSCLNPFVYCLRLSDIRTEVLKTLRKFRCLSSRQCDSNQATN